MATHSVIESLMKHNLDSSMIPDWLSIRHSGDEHRISPGIKMVCIGSVATIVTTTFLLVLSRTLTQVAFEVATQVFVPSSVWRPLRWPAFLILATLSGASIGAIIYAPLRYGSVGQRVANVPVPTVVPVVVGCWLYALIKFMVWTNTGLFTTISVGVREQIILISGGTGSANFFVSIGILVVGSMLPGSPTYRWLVNAIPLSTASGEPQHSFNRWVAEYHSSDEADEQSRDRAEAGESSSTSSNTSQENRSSETTPAPTSQRSESHSGSRIPLKNTQYDFDWRSPEQTFRDVGGKREERQQISEEVVAPLNTSSEKAERFGISIPNVLFHGPPGTGKTYLAKATAGEIGRRSKHSVAFVELTSSKLTSKYINESAQVAQALFRQAEILAREGFVAVIFIDEIDALLSKRGGGLNSHEEDEKVVAEWLNLLEKTGIGVGNGAIMIIAATNKRDKLDDAAVRTGRFDTEFHIPKPDIEEQVAILKAQLVDRPGRLTKKERQHICAQLDEPTAADIGNLVDDAARHAALKRNGDRVVYSDFQAVL